MKIKHSLFNDNIYYSKYGVRSKRKMNEYDKNKMQEFLDKMNNELYKDTISLEYARQIIMNMLNYNLIVKCKTLKEVHAYLDDLSTEGKKAATAGWLFKDKMSKKLKLERIN